MSRIVKVSTLVVIAVFLIKAMVLVATAADSPVKFSVDVGAQYTDNRDSSEDAVSSFDMSLKPRVNMNLSLEENFLDLYYTPCYTYRTRPSDTQNDSELFHDLGVNIKYMPAPRIDTRLLEKFSYTDDPAIDEGGTTLRRDSSYIVNSAEAGVNYLLSRRSNLDFFGRHSIKRYDEASVATEQDEDSVSAGLTMMYQVAKNVAMLAMADVGSQQYETSFDRGFDSMSGGLGLESILSKNLRSGLRLGWKGVDYDDSALDSESAPYADLSVEVKTIPSTRITAGVGYALKGAGVYPYSSQKSTDVHGKLEWDAVANLTLAVSGTYRVGEYDSDSVSISAPADAYYDEQSGEEKAIIATTEAAYKIGANTSIKFVQMYEDVDSDVSSSFTRNTSNLVLSRQF